MYSIATVLIPTTMLPNLELTQCWLAICHLVVHFSHTDSQRGYIWMKVGHVWTILLTVCICHSKHFYIDSHFAYFFLLPCLWISEVNTTRDVIRFKKNKVTVNNKNQIRQKCFKITSENNGNRGNIVTLITQIHDRSLSWLGPYTQINSCGVTCKTVVSAQTSPLQWFGHRSDYHIWVNVYLILWRFGLRQLFCLF